MIQNTRLIIQRKAVIDELATPSSAHRANGLSEFPKFREIHALSILIRQESLCLSNRSGRYHGRRSGPETAAADQVSSRVQPESRHEKGQYRGHEKVRSAGTGRVRAQLLICLTRWIAGKISEALGSEDDVVIELCFNLLEGSRFVCFSSLQPGPRLTTA